MVYYDILGFDSFDDYFNKYYNSILSTNHTFEYFVNWEKIYKKVEEYLVEISILSSLSKVDKDKCEEQFRKILVAYPETVQILPIILAIRIKKDLKVDILDDELKGYSFNPKDFDVEDIIYFSKKTGILNLFSHINDLYAYIIGTEVGLDTNARKNRSGTLFEALIEDKLLSLLKGTGYDLKVQETVDNINRDKRADFIITKNNQQLIIIECNFYNTGGSKPIEVASAYIELQSEIDKTDAKLLWITDGLAWNKMKNSLTKAMESIDYVVNYNMLEGSLMRVLEDVDKQ